MSLSTVLNPHGLGVACDASSPTSSHCVLLRGALWSSVTQWSWCQPSSAPPDLFTETSQVVKECVQHELTVEKHTLCTHSFL